MKLQVDQFVRRVTAVSLLVTLLLLTPTPLSAANRVFKPALPGYRFNFPRDHASHDEYKTEWWYYTGHLTAEDGGRYGYELTFFRSALDAPQGLQKGSWAAGNIYMAHFAVTDLGKKQFFYQQRLTRPGVDFAGASTREYKVWNKDWRARMDTSGRHLLIANSPEYSINLTLQTDKPPAIQGENGVSQKANCTGCASHYYSFTRLKTTGFIRLGDKRLKVIGSSWMDHEFGSNQLTADQVGWDWFSIQLDDNTEVMLYVMRLKNGGLDPNSSGTLVFANGSTRHLRKADYSIKRTATWRSPNTKAVYPMGWDVEIPSFKANLKIVPELENQELAKKAPSEVTYWEGACTVSGEKNGKPIKGQAYVEMTGYHEMFSKKI
jgi:predicted secreted hydrolase